MKLLNNIINRGKSSAGGRLALLGVSIALAGCRGVPVRTERMARNDLHMVTAGYHVALPALDSEHGLSNFVLYAVLNSPQVRASYYEWAGSVERITTERSLPDPQITFQSDIARVVMTVMPGFMQEFPGPGKLRARAAVAGAESQSRYFAFESAVLEAAYDLRRAYFDLHFLDDRLRIDRQTLSLLADLERIARAQNEVGKGTLQDVLRAQIEWDRVGTEIQNLEDSRRPMLESFKAALGLAADQPNPPVPSGFEISDTIPDAELLQVAFRRNPALKALEADVRAAQAGIALAYKERVPDFSLGLMADAKAAPTLFRPLAGMTLPIWRDKIAAEIARAQAGQLAAQARLNSRQIALAVDFATRSFTYREITRNLDLLKDKLIPKARQSLEIARAGYLSGTIDFFNLMDTERTLLNFELDQVDALTQREIVLSELSLIIAGVPPAGAPLLDPEIAPARSFSKNYEARH